MKRSVENFISSFTFRRRYGLWSRWRYDQFLEFVSEKIEQVLDRETKLVFLSFHNDWKDGGGNVHVSISGTVERRNERGELGAIIVWLKRRKTFRGSFWSRLNPKSDAELLSEAKSLFHAGRYLEFLGLARHLESVYSTNRIFTRMIVVAKRKARESSNNTNQGVGAI
ncbi:hypothetical protein [Petrachloros mirabilis]